MKRLKAADQFRQQEFGLQRQREQREQQREDREAANADREFELKQTAERHRFIEAGGIPERSDLQAVPAGRAAITPLQFSPIARAMGSGLPPMRLTPSAATRVTEIGGTAPVNALEMRTTPESFDATRSGGYQRGVDAALIRENALTEREAGRNDARASTAAAHDARVAAMRESAQRSAEALVKLRGAEQRRTSAIAKAMGAPTQRERSLVGAAADLIEKAEGSYDAAADFLNNTSQGRALAKAGVTELHLSQAHAEYVNRNTKQAADLTKGAFAFSPDSAAFIVKGLRKNLNGNAASAALRDTSSSGDDFTDAEVLAAYNAGKRTNRDITEFIRAQRLKSKPRR